MENLIALDQELFLLLNSLHTEWMDQVVYWATKTITWIPFYLFLIYLIVKNFKVKAIGVILFIVLSITIADRTTSGFMKPYFERFRPSHEPTLEGMVHTVNGYEGGRYGFASSHAANSFAIAMFLWLVFRKQYPKIGWLFVWAFLFSYTRIYLGLHYPGDILAGAFVGLLAGFIGYAGLQSVVLKTRK